MNAMVPPLLLLRTVLLLSSFSCSAAALTFQRRGRGPPLLFSTGLAGTMPRYLYKDVITRLEKDFTVFTCPEARSMDELADAIGARTVALVTHSSFRPELLLSNRVERAVLCDPAMVPDAEESVRRGRLSPQAVRVPCPTLVIRTESAYESGFIPSAFDARLLADDLRTVTIGDAGHADLLDDRWAALGARASGMLRGKGVGRRRMAPFQTWAEGEAEEEGAWWSAWLPGGASGSGGGEGAERAGRKEYRAEMAERIAAFLMEVEVEEEKDVVWLDDDAITTVEARISVERKKGFGDGEPDHEEGQVQ